MNHVLGFRLISYDPKRGSVKGAGKTIVELTKSLTVALRDAAHQLAIDLLPIIRELRIN